ncbi:Uncharacterised protein [Mycobacteroides abscessus subsp. abscessus]|nr:Uncharacterised protein [Mycobacteroides abscessus subsp. abscessus]
MGVFGADAEQFGDQGHIDAALAVHADGDGFFGGVRGELLGYGDEQVGGEDLGFACRAGVLVEDLQ